MADPNNIKTNIPNFMLEGSEDQLGNVIGGKNTRSYIVSYTKMGAFVEQVQYLFKSIHLFLTTYHIER